MTSARRLASAALATLSLWVLAANVFVDFQRVRIKLLTKPIARGAFCLAVAGGRDAHPGRATGPRLSRAQHRRHAGDRHRAAGRPGARPRNRGRRCFRPRRCVVGALGHARRRGSGTVRHVGVDAGIRRARQRARFHAWRVRPIGAATPPVVYGTAGVVAAAFPWVLDPAGLRPAAAVAAVGACGARDPGDHECGALSADGALAMGVAVSSRAIRTDLRAGHRAVLVACSIPRRCSGAALAVSSPRNAHGGAGPGRICRRDGRGGDRLRHPAVAAHRRLCERFGCLGVFKPRAASRRASREHADAAGARPARGGLARRRVRTRSDSGTTGPDVSRRPIRWGCRWPSSRPRLWWGGRAPPRSRCGCTPCSVLP